MPIQCYCKIVCLHGCFVFPKAQFLYGQIHLILHRVNKKKIIEFGGCKVIMI